MHNVSKTDLIILAKAREEIQIITKNTKTKTKEFFKNGLDVKLEFWSLRLQLEHHRLKSSNF